MATKNSTNDTANENFITDHGSIRLTNRRDRRGPRAAAEVKVARAARTASATLAPPNTARPAVAGRVAVLPSVVGVAAGVTVVGAVVVAAAAPAGGAPTRAVAATVARPFEGTGAALTGAVSGSRAGSSAESLPASRFSWPSSEPGGGGMP